MKIFDQILGTLSEYLHKRGMGTAPSNGLLDFKRLNTYSPQFSPGNSWPGGDLVMKALVKNLTFVLLGSVVTFNIHAQNPDRIITPYEIEQGQNKAVELYEDGKYEEAFEESSIAAQRGMKTAQYLLGIMFLKGEYVQQSLPIGMAWLGVASEADQDDWHATYKQVYDSLPANA